VRAASALTSSRRDAAKGGLRSIQLITESNPGSATPGKQAAGSGQPQVKIITNDAGITSDLPRNSPDETLSLPD
jgi:hypothetical protein